MSEQTISTLSPGMIWGDFKQGRRTQPKTRAAQGGKARRTIFSSASAVPSGQVSWHVTSAVRKNI